MSAACGAPDVRRGSFGERFVDCTAEGEEEEEEGEGSYDASYDGDEDSHGATQSTPRAGGTYSYDYSYDEEHPVRAWAPRREPGCGCSGYSNAHGYGSSCKAWESHLDPVHSCGCEETLFTVGVGVAPRPAAGAVVLRVRGVRRARRAARLVLGGLPGLHPSPRPEARHRTTPLNRPRPPRTRCTLSRATTRPRHVHDMPHRPPLPALLPPVRRYALRHRPLHATPCACACRHDVHDVSGTCPR